VTIKDITTPKTRRYTTFYSQCKKV